MSQFILGKTTVLQSFKQVLIGTFNSVNPIKQTAAATQIHIIASHNCTFYTKKFEFTARSLCELASSTQWHRLG